jgi:hypothetical protein
MCWNIRRRCVWIAQRTFTSYHRDCAVCLVLSVTSVAFGVRSTEDLRELMESSLASKEIVRKRKEMLRKELKDVKGMKLDEELNYFSEKLFEDPAENDNKQKKK